MALPEPEAGLVISFNHLWRREHEAGREHGRYARPCAIVVASRRESDDALVVTVVPITTKPPPVEDEAIPMPLAVKRRLGLNADMPSWIIVDEVNEFVWPGFDLQPRADGTIAYGFIPPALHAQIRDQLLASARSRRLGITRR